MTSPGWSSKAASHSLSQTVMGGGDGHFQLGAVLPVCWPHDSSAEVDTKRPRVTLFQLVITAVVSLGIPQPAGVWVAGVSHWLLRCPPATPLAVLPRPALAGPPLQGKVPSVTLCSFLCVPVISAAPCICSSCPLNREHTPCAWLWSLDCVPQGPVRGSGSPCR